MAGRGGRGQGVAHGEHEAAARARAPPAVIREDELRRLLATCDGTVFDERRDNAIIRLFLDTGMRRGELSGLRVEDIDFSSDVAHRRREGSAPRACPFGRKTAQAIDRYLRARGKHADARSEWLWLGLKGRLTETASSNW